MGKRLDKIKSFIGKVFGKSKGDSKLTPEEEKLKKEHDKKLKEEQKKAEEARKQKEYEEQIERERIKEEQEKKRMEGLAKRAFEAERSVLISKAVDELWDLWYEDKHNRLRTLNVRGLEDNVRIRLANELSGRGGLASRMAKDEATPEEIRDFVNKIMLAIEYGDRYQ